MNNKKKKLLFIGPYPPPLSGPELSNKQLLESDLKNHFQITFLNTNVRKDNVSKGKIDFSSIFSVFKFNLKLLIQLILNKPDIAYHLVTPTEIGWLGRDILFILQCHFFRVKKVIHFRGSHLNINYKNFSKITQKLIRYSCAFVDAAIVQSKCLKNQFDKLVDHNKIFVIPNTVENFYSNIKRKPTKNPQILFFGHLTKAKGYTDILKIIPSVIQKFPETRFVFCGNIRKGAPGVKYNQFNGERIVYEDPFVQQSKILSSKYKKNYKNLGVVNGDEKLKLLSESWLFILPSYSEGFSRSILESMAAGIPIISTPVGANIDILINEYNGMIVKPGELFELENSICKLLSNRKIREALSKNSKNYFKKNFTEEIVVKKYINLFNKI